MCCFPLPSTAVGSTRLARVQLREHRCVTLASSRSGGDRARGGVAAARTDEKLDRALAPSALVVGPRREPVGGLLARVALPRVPRIGARQVRRAVDQASGDVEPATVRVADGLAGAVDAVLPPDLLVSARHGAIARWALERRAERRALAARSHSASVGNRYPLALRF